MSAATEGRATRPAFALMVVWMLNNLLFLLVGLGGVAVNMITYLVQHGRVPVEGAGRGPEAWAGFMPFVVPWWFFALSAAVMVVVVVLAQDPAWRWEPDATRANLLWRTAPPLLIAWAVFFTVFQSAAVRYYDVSWVVLNPYLIGPALSVVALALAVRVWVRTRARTTRTAVKPTTLARVLGVLSLANLTLLVVVGPVAIALQQLGHLAGTGNTTPPVGDARSAAEVWFGHLPFQVPWWVLLLSALMTLGVTVAAQLPGGRTDRPLWLATTPGPLTIAAIVAFLIQWSIGPFSSTGPEQLLAPLACVIAIVVGLVSFRTTAERARGARPRAGVRKRG